MDKQEEIREELANKIYGIRMHLDNKTREEQADDILSYQDSKGLVFKGQEHPRYPGWFKIESLVKNE